MESYRKYLIAKSLGISLAILCWTMAAVQFFSSLCISKTKMTNAFIETSNTNNLYCIKDINQTTKELIFTSDINSQSQALDAITVLIKKYDKNTVAISNNNAGNYCDYYFYSPKLNHNDGIVPLSQGFNIHVAITDAPVHIYIGTPYIDYDF